MKTKTSSAVDSRAAFDLAGEGASNNSKNPMKKNILLLAALLAIAGSTVTLVAQDSPGRQRPNRGDGPRGPGHRPPPVMAVLDANKDGVIDSAEIDNAPAALRTLDKNNDGSLTIEELRPKMRGGPRGEGAPAEQE